MLALQEATNALFLGRDEFQVCICTCAIQESTDLQLPE